MRPLPGRNEVWRQRHATLAGKVARRDFAFTPALARLLKDDAQDSARRIGAPN